ncbi:MAG TPA: Stp1/IreP family PP2C-type Ser/Thr phosphatase [Firmicutes bacterium]|jgi:serine/threonine protein phosphatase PrpC|nr:Stp1/IreP family PP2C-type Ser/Thr phosphatase [Bacillota bacterium]
MLTFTARSHRGYRREKNEDRFYVPPKNGPFLFAVADGMGGCAAGEVASSIAIDLVEKKAGEKFSSALQGDIPGYQLFLRELIREANEEILAAQRQNCEFEGMGTTLTVVYFCENEFLVGHVGDSRVSLLNGENFLQITEDHSLVAQLVKKGEVNPEKAYLHPKRHLLTRALGAASFNEVDLYRVKFQSGNYILLYTDGLTSMLRPIQIKEIIIRCRDVEQAADELLKQAIDLGGLDNITFVLIYVS